MSRRRRRGRVADDGVLGEQGEQRGVAGGGLGQDRRDTVEALELPVALGRRDGGVGLDPGALLAHQQGDDLELGPSRRLDPAALGVGLDLAHGAGQHGDDPLVVEGTTAPLGARGGPGGAGLALASLSQEVLLKDARDVRAVRAERNDRCRAQSRGRGGCGTPSRAARADRSLRGPTVLGQVDVPTPTARPPRATDDLRSSPPGAELSRCQRCGTAGSRYTSIVPSPQRQARRADDAAYAAWLWLSRVRPEDRASGDAPRQMVGNVYAQVPICGTKCHIERIVPLAAEMPRDALPQGVLPWPSSDPADCRRGPASSLAVAATTLGLTACSGGDEATTSDADGALVFGISADPTQTIPWLSTSTQSIQVLGQIYSTVLNTTTDLQSGSRPERAAQDLRRRPDLHLHPQAGREVRQRVRARLRGREVHLRARSWTRPPRPRRRPTSHPSRRSRPRTRRRSWSSSRRRTRRSSPPCPTSTPRSSRRTCRSTA